METEGDYVFCKNKGMENAGCYWKFGGVIRQEPGTSRSSRPVLVRVTEQDTSVDTDE